MRGATEERARRRGRTTGGYATNVTIGNEVTVGDRCLIGANTLVTKDLRDGQVAVAPFSEVLRVNSDPFLRFSRFR